MSRMNALSSGRNTAFVSAEDCSVFESRMELLAYKKMYNVMFNVATDVIGKIKDAEAILCKAQQDCEEILMEAVDAEDPVLMARTEM